MRKLPRLFMESKRWIPGALITNDDGKITKPPVALEGDHDAYPISYSNRDHWRSLADAERLVGREVNVHRGERTLSGVIGPPGFSLGDEGIWEGDLQLVCLDLDRCVEKGRLTREAQTLIDEFSGVSFQEKSVSGNGYHIWTWVAGGVDKTSLTLGSLKIDVLAKRGYVVVTGDGDGELGNGTEPFNRLIRPLLRSTTPRRSTQDNITIDWSRLYSAVRSLDPDLDYSDWLRVLMGLHSLNHKWAYEMALEWSGIGEKFDGDESFARKWESFSIDSGITAATIFSMALEAGWDGKATLEDDGRKWRERQAPPLRIRVGVGAKEPPKRIRVKKRLEVVPERGALLNLYERLKKTSPLDTPGIFLGGALGAGAFLTENRFFIDVGLGPLSLNPYIFIAAGTGVGKNSVLRLVKDLKLFSDVSGAVLSGIQSHLALAQVMSEQGSTFLMTDEAIDWLEGANSSNQQGAIIAAITQAYGNGRGLIPGIPGRAKPIPDAIDSALTPLLLGQVARLERVLTNDRLTSGFFPRFLLLNGKPRAIQEVQKVRPLEDDVGEFQTWARRLGSSTRVKLSSEVMTKYRELKHHELQLQVIESPEVRYWSRAAQNTLIVAGLSAVLARETAITEEDWAFAERLVRRSIHEWATIFEETPEGDLVDTRVRNGVLRFLRSPARIQKRAANVASDVAKELAADQWARFGDLRYGCSVREIPTGVLERVVESLVREELVEEGTVGTKVFYRATPGSWV